MRLSKEYTTFIPVLLKVMEATRGPVLELGSGVFSTPLLHWLCAEKRRELWTFEESSEYFEFAKKFQSRTHHVRQVQSWDFLKELDGEWSVALIDQLHDRGKTAEMLKDKVDYIILHDSEAPEIYGYDKVYDQFKYRHDWKFCKPWTTVVSNKQKLGWIV